MLELLLAHLATFHLFHKYVLDFRCLITRVNHLFKLNVGILNIADLDVLIALDNALALLHIWQWQRWRAALVLTLADAQVRVMKRFVDGDWRLLAICNWGVGRGFSRLLLDLVHGEVVEE